MQIDRSGENLFNLLMAWVGNLVFGGRVKLEKNVLNEPTTETLRHLLFGTESVQLLCIMYCFFLYIYEELYVPLRLGQL
jgi:hypothetical protein